jgi:peptidase M23-like protein
MVPGTGLVGIALALAPTGHVVAPPSPVQGTDRRTHLVYELLLHNGTGARLRLERLDVAARAQGRALVTYRGAAIAELLAPAERIDRRVRSLRPGRDGVLFMDVALPRGRPAPGRLVHRLRFARPAGARRTITVTGARTTVDRRAPLVLAPPLHADRLLVVDAHARGLMLIDGRLRFSQRYALDILRVNEQGDNTFAGDPALNESHAVYGMPVTAVGPGRVIATRNDLPDNTPVGTLPETVTHDNVAGNFVVQSLPGGRFALYAHFRPGTVAVAPGDVVQTGQPLGLVGNSGNSTEPHLHLHVADAPDVFEANGRPYVFSAFRLDGHVSGLQSGSPTLEPAAPPADRTAELPLNGDLVIFP